jgi:hypothetical protein
MSHKIDGTAITRMLILRNIFEIVNIGSFAQHQLIGKGHKMVLHVCAPPLDELKSLFKQQFAQGSGNVAAIPKEPAAQSFDHLGNRSAVIDIAWRQTTGQQFPLLVDDQMQLKAKEPAHAFWAMPGIDGKDTVSTDAFGFIDRRRSRANEADARTSTKAALQISKHGNYTQGMRWRGFLPVRRVRKLKKPRLKRVLLCMCL